jgi:DNA helicase-2/ATP-dependent DNA helicase PcrA
MFETLSPIQRTIALEKSGEFVVRACPGSGKTYSVAARLAHQLENWNLPYRGIAALSFTNVAWQEIEKKLHINFNVRDKFSNPHFLGTIDSFINNYIFLPHGHLVMDCIKRPILVGQPYNEWGVKHSDRDYDQYFGKISFGVDDQLVYPHIQGTFFFPFTQIYKKDGTESVHAKHLREVKAKYWKKGYANQHDANYFALRVLQKYPAVAKAIAFRFPEFLLDEAQDTNDVQMQILDLLNQHGLKNIMLVGDPDQAIFEWNNAKPALFTGKFDAWKENSIILNQNRRSSQIICDSTFLLSTLEVTSEAVDLKVKDFKCKPSIVTYTEENIESVIKSFLEQCQLYKIPIKPENVALLCRSQSFVNALAGGVALPEPQWTNDYNYTHPILKSLCLYHRGRLKDAIKAIELPFCRFVNKTEIVTKQDVDLLVEKYGHIKYHKIIYDFLNKFPSTYASGTQWLDSLKITFPSLKINMQINESALGICIQKLFAGSEKALSNKDYGIGTVHSVKGETYEAVLLFLKKKGLGQYYTTMLQNNASLIDEEEMRIVYVGITRPRRLLMIAVPDEVNRQAWTSKLGL